MFVYQKKLQYPVRIKNTNPKLASLIISQYGGPECQRGGRESVPEFVKKKNNFYFILFSSSLYSDERFSCYTVNHQRKQIVDREKGGKIMNILILTGQFGMGHVVAAQAIEQEILRQDPTASVVVVDIVERCAPQLRRLVYGCFDFTVNYCSGVYNILNRMAGHCSCSPMKRTMVQKVDQMLYDSQADLVISTLPLSSQYISAYKQTTGSSIPLYTYVTDIEAHNEWIAPETDCYFVGDESTRQQLLRRGISPERVVVSGIPVRQGFHPVPRPVDGPRELLVMGGGLGLIPHADTLLSALVATPNLHVTVITGKNEALRWELQQAYPSFTVLGYTDRVAEYMAKADLLLTKAGGITTFEAIHAGTPLCLLRPFLMQEEANARYVEQHGFGTVLWQKGYEVETLLALLQNPEELADMRQRMAVSLRSLDLVTPLDYFWQSRRKAAC